MEIDVPDINVGVCSALGLCLPGNIGLIVGKSQNTYKTKTANAAAAIDSGYAHRCSACDGGFSTIEAYRTHGSQVGASESCRSAVLYGLEHC